MTESPAIIPTAITDCGSDVAADKLAAENNPFESPDFACNICLESPIEAVVSFCGHLFCWSCLYTWMQVKAEKPVCPVCKSYVNREKVVPIYGRASDKLADCATPHIPPRPAATPGAEPSLFTDPNDPWGMPDAQASLFSWRTDSMRANVHLQFGLAGSGLPRFTTVVQLDQRVWHELVSNTLLGIGFSILVWLLFV